ncbi:spore coat U domain-containing protein [Atlantibacter sp.]|uniref:Csu type fimbrial protein n=1 Tax=Atlantibacter sp. TaxID=1903473 RepID=UPI0028AE437F|nr:spore coat U domain-containing protein [Atlantibacter sp.]
MLRRVALVIGLLIALPGGAVTTQSFQVNATIAAGCSVASGVSGVFGTLDFGSHSGVDNRRVTTGFVPNTALNLACTPGVTLSMAIDGGQHYGSVRNLQRANGAERVPYRLYSAASLAANSEIGVNQAVTVSYTNSNNITLPIFAAAQLTGMSPAGTYSDQLTVTLSW